MPVLQLAAAFDNLSRLAQKLPAALVPSRPVDGKSIEKRLFEADCHSPQQRSVDAHRNVIYKALVGNYDAALAMMCGTNRETLSTLEVGTNVRHDSNARFHRIRWE